MSDSLQKKYRISELLGPTIQGEGRNAGRPCFFIRLSGCNLWPDESKPSFTCPWCDTPQLHRSVELTAKEVRTALSVLASNAGVAVKDLGKFGLVITGGEPLLQLDNEFLWEVSHPFSWVDIETNGTVAPKFDFTVFRREEGFNINISCSPKTHVLKVRADWYKVLIPAKKGLLEYVLAHDPGAVIYLQPVEDRSADPSEREKRTKENLQAAVDLSLREGYRLSVQLHKILSLP